MPLRIRRRAATLAAAASSAAAVVPLLFGLAGARGADLYWDANGATAGAAPGGGSTAPGTWGVDPFWSSSAAGTSSTGAWTNGNNAIFSAGSDATGSFTVTVANTRSGSAINFEEGEVTLTGGGLIFPAIDVSGGASATIASVLGGAAGLTKSGAGTLTLATANTYTGATTVGAGTLRLATSNAADSGGALNIASGTFDLNGFNQTITDLALGDGVATASANVVGAGTLTLGGNITYTSKPVSQTAPATIAANVILPAGAHTIANAGADVSTATDDLVISGSLSGAGDLIESGSSDFDVALSAANTYGGATTVNSGGLVLAANNAIPSSSAVTVAAGANVSTATAAQSGVVPGNYGQSIGSLAGGGNVFIGAAVWTIGNNGASTTFGGAISGAGGALIKSGSGTLTLTGANTYTGGTTIAGGTLQVSDGGTSGSIGGDVANNGKFITNRSDDLTFAGAISGSGVFTKMGGGLLVLTGSNTYTGETQLLSGILRAVPGVGLPPTGLLRLRGVYQPTTTTFTRSNVLFDGGGIGAFGNPLVVNIGGNGATLNVGDFMILNDATSTSPLEIQNGIAWPYTNPLTIEVDSNAVTLSGPLTASVQGLISTLTKTGQGALLLRNAGNMQGGSVKITAGVLDIVTDHNLGSAGSGATIVIGGGTFRAGADLTLNANRSLVMAAGGGTFDTQGFDVTAAGAISGSTTFTKTGPGTLTVGSNNTGLTSTFVIAGGTVVAPSASSLGSTSAVLAVALDSGTLRAAGPLLATNRNVFLAAGGGAIDSGGFDSTFRNLDGVGSGSFTKTGAGKLSLNYVRLPGNVGSNLSVNGGKLVVVPNGQAGGVSAVNSIAIGGGGALDITSNHLVVRSTPVGSASGGVYNGVSGLIQSGRNGFGWGGSGIVTSQTDATSSDFTSIGVATASQVKGIAAGATATWAGQTVTGSDTLVMYTYGGDANLDGKINVDDYGRIDLNANLGTAGWYNGDFNYDGKINVDDYGIIDFNVGIQGAPFFTAGNAGGLGGVSAVPEPATASLLVLAIAAPTVMSRRRRRDRAPALSI